MKLLVYLTRLIVTHLNPCLEARQQGGGELVDTTATCEKDCCAGHDRGQSNYFSNKDKEREKADFKGAETTSKASPINAATTTAKSVTSTHGQFKAAWSICTLLEDCAPE